MGDGIGDGLGDLERAREDALAAHRNLEESRRRSQSALEKMMRIFGSDMMRAFELLEQAKANLDAGAAGRASTLARAAGYALVEPARENDKGRSKASIVAEICEIIDPKIEQDPFGGQAVTNQVCIMEVVTRLRTAQHVAIGLIKDWHNGPRSKQLSSGDVEEIVGEIVGEEHKQLPDQT